MLSSRSVAAALMLTKAASRLLHASASHGHHGLLPRSVAPAFSLPSVVGADITTTSLASYRGRWTVLITYPLDHTFVCPTELIAFSEALPAFRAIGAEVLALSVDSVYSHLAWQTKPRDKGGLGGVAFPLLSDVGGRVSRTYGAIIDDEDDADYGAGPGGKRGASVAGSGAGPRRCGGWLEGERHAGNGAGPRAPLGSRRRGKACEGPVLGAAMLGDAASRALPELGGAASSRLPYLARARLACVAARSRRSCVARRLAR